MAEVRDLLIEIGTEELPPKALSTLSAAFADGIGNRLQEAEIAFTAVLRFATPRRLAVLVQGLATAQPDRVQVRRGPALAAAFDADGLPTKAALGFARSCGVDASVLETIETERGAWLAHRSQQTGAPTTALVPDIVREALARLPIPRRMRWGSGEAEFVRPVHWVVLLFGDEPITAQVLGVAAGRETRGHRFHHPQPIYLAEPAGYAPILETEGRVLADFRARRDAIRAQVEEIAVGVGGHAVIDDDLLDEVTSMVEWPVAILGNFDARFLDIPHEALISAMKQHQKYFHVVDGSGRLLPQFVTVSNIDSGDPEQVRAGNERVIRPRLSDAEFFWQQDRKRSLAERTDELETIVFHQQLGTLHQRVQRLSALAASVANDIGADEALARRAALLCKCDLLTDMVGEFPDLQGTMGRYYALQDGEPEAVAQAIEEHYRPRHAGDAPPSSPTGCALAIADKLDTLVGIFGVGELPSGTKDPFGLRRAAIGVLRSVIEQPLQQVSLEHQLEVALNAYREQGLAQRFTLEHVGDSVYDFMMERLRAYYHDQGITHDVFQAVLHVRPMRPYDFDQRVQAVNAFASLAEAESLTTANKRCHNLLKKAAAENIQIAAGVDPDRLENDAERVLAGQITALAEEVRPLVGAFAYDAALRRLAGLRATVDTFFDQVMVMTDDADLRANRLALLQALRDLFLQVADVSLLQA